MRLKIGYAEHLKDQERELIDAVNDGKTHVVKITTNKIDIRKDRRDDRYIDSLRNIKIIYEIDMIKDTIKLFGLSDYKNVNSFIYSSILFIDWYFVNSVIFFVFSNFFSSIIISSCSILISIIFSVYINVKHIKQISPISFIAFKHIT